MELLFLPPAFSPAAPARRSGPVRRRLRRGPNRARRGVLPAEIERTGGV